jgi:ferritin
MPAIPVPSAVASELQRQLNQELGSAHAYLALAAWCHFENFKGFARYFSKQSFEERAHAQKFFTHLLDRGVLPVATALPAPKTAFPSILDVAKQAQSMEASNTAGVKTAYEAALKDKDYAAQVFLQYFINEQVEEENWADEMVQRVEQALCAGAIGFLDRHIERYLEEEGVEVAKPE